MPIIKYMWFVKFIFKNFILYTMPIFFIKAVYQPSAVGLSVVVLQPMFE
jgi:hypothetical protein